MKNRPVPLEPDYQYKYLTSQNRQSDHSLEKKQTFVDSKTGILYEHFVKDNNESDILFNQNKPTGTLRMSALNDSHIYNTLESHDASHS